METQEQESGQQVTLFSSMPLRAAGEEHRSNSPAERSEPPNRQVGAHQWSNNKKLSDIVLRYGDQGQHVFHGHKVILASSSLWFQAAFTNQGFTEADSGEITLEGDEVEPLLQMLHACYLPNNKYQSMPPWSDERIKASQNSNKFILFHVSMYAVVDKYDAPKIREHVVTHVTTWLKTAMTLIKDCPASPQVIELVGLRGVLDKVYEITGHRDLSDPLRTAVLDVIMDHPATKPIGMATPGTLAAEVVRAAEGIPEFGRDMFLRTMQAVPTAASPAAFLDVVEQVTCPYCNSKAVKLAEYVTVRCQFCGTNHAWK